MAITSSAKKAIRSSARKKKFNDARKAAYKNAIKKVRKLAIGKKFDDARDSLKEAYKAIDKAAKTKLIKKNAASRMKSRISKFVGKSAK
ncbi:MAG: 30S ribosomal protein S20 [Candidatus Taylorbacteria bacterium RIFCSPLOWO2_12_FULL_43_20]|uniref:Small ribosomal subunit protein bS20 n=1 Tax=Candidatus Taylorbacteria bacterium RIFCSPLOWO2_12_FULL_43_20 TaxID=1802332 RepID=A0A1G2P141_9BACT|nr:MAG: 30S ribosomal protein S20 [Candidatus Taylorbacteria bacterium RIFCSPHIGHO2_02_FULL_43_55]OHA29931.1 MAG: 30S ribosomal protein S20 [Candidatus Taylorbacteria bacterium RIFCSPHIGHO2_12_FULL_42_34]OHA30563.1 MAG: 30S ribosomal protein S20 [Candidatus Taylorbacteria bacterium RIFCSPLOWO2_01_FULL_43_83]OHA38395.1 MAG: 30S ribosomal protein S20 [Candidatus Taylorbacteria bacterium RIFCSPLOWO2_02_FULL_43_22b]OHA42003.1 MAG: 30S ribosomal protein S20 [Candidatus Taylorbacteria bacterium RIFCS